MVEESYIDVAVSGPMYGSFTYKLPATDTDLTPGQRLLVPVRQSRKIGYYLGLCRQPQHIRVREIIRELDSVSYFSPDLFALCKWIAQYYFANPADCLAAALPPAVKTTARPGYLWTTDSGSVPDRVAGRHRPGKKLTAQELRQLQALQKGYLRQLINGGAILEIWPEDTGASSKQLRGYRCADPTQWGTYFDQKKIKPEPYDGIKTRRELLAHNWTPYYLRAAVKDGLLEPVLGDEPVVIPDYLVPRRDLDNIKLTAEQQSVYDRLAESLAPEQGFQPFLLHGVTGSGKTIVYCRLAQKVLAMGRTVLVLTPEIALAGTTLAYFKGLFGDAVTVLHSAMTNKERLQSFTGIQRGRFNIVIGPRSAVFAPLQNLGLVIVDEEHDPSYKQSDPAPRFHGRDCAIMRARLNNIPVILGSASPSIESYYQAESGKYRLLEIKQRPAGARLPTTAIVDMKTARLGGDLGYFSHTLKKEIDRRLKQDEQTILFLNRRGYAPHLKCAECGRVPECPNCQVKLTYHKAGQKLSCHYCGWITTRYDSCETCQSTRFLFVGAGTQKVEEAIPRLFGGVVPLRLDSDTAVGRRQLFDILTEFIDGKSSLLLGTQMVTKGFDLPGVTLVGVLSADLMLDLPDFRASERTFAQLLQVSGRSGRADKPGEVVIQTYYPENDVITLAAQQNYRAFYEIEIENRRALEYPPFRRLVNIVLSGKNEGQLESAALKFKGDLLSAIGRSNLSAGLLGPAPCPLYYLRNRFRRHLLIKTRQTVKLVEMLARWEKEHSRFGLPSAVKVVVDVDPVDMM